MLKTIEGGVIGFKFLHGLLSHKNMKILKKFFFGDPPLHPQKNEFGQTKVKMGCFSQKGFCYSFEILHEDSNERRKKIVDPPTPLKKPILGGQTPKWAVSSRRVCATVLEFCMGS